jgi:hypothetical protein
LRDSKGTTTHGAKTPRPAKPGADDLEPYRRLIEIQKQLVKMAKQNEQTRRECDALREQAARDLFESLRWKGTFRARLRRKAFRLLKRLPRMTPAEIFRVLNKPAAL